MRFTERVGLLIWVFRHHEEMIQELEAELEQAYDEIDALKLEIKRLKEARRREEGNSPVAHSLHGVFRCHGRGLAALRDLRRG